MMSDEARRAFAESWESAQGDDFISRMARRSLEAVAEGKGDLSEALTELRKPLQERLDLHLGGEGVRNHATDTSALGAFFTEVADAVKEVAKSLAGRAQWTSRLVSVAPAPGSVHLQFEVPAGPQPELEGTQSPSLDSQALRSVTNLIVQAESGSDALEASTQTLRPSARLAVRKLAETVLRSHWDFEGSLVARGRPTVDVHLTAEGARRLYSEAARSNVDTTTVTLKGVCDGWVWSSGALRFIPRGKRPFTASVPPALQTLVAGLVAEKGTEVEAEFMMTSRTIAGTERRLRTSYALRVISPVNGNRAITGQIRDTADDNEE